MLIKLIFLHLSCKLFFEVWLFSVMSIFGDAIIKHPLGLKRNTLIPLDRFQDPLHLVQRPACEL